MLGMITADHVPGFDGFASRGRGVDVPAGELAAVVRAGLPGWYVAGWRSRPGAVSVTVTAVDGSGPLPGLLVRAGDNLTVWPVVVTPAGELAEGGRRRLSVRDGDFFTARAAGMIRGLWAVQGREVLEACCSRDGRPVTVGDVRAACGGGVSYRAAGERIAGYVPFSHSAVGVACRFLDGERDRAGAAGRRAAFRVALLSAGGVA